jgi:hypothetical protein
MRAHQQIPLSRLAQDCPADLQFSAVDDRETIRCIKEEVAAGKIPGTFKPADVNKALKIDWAGVFLSKHREGNPGGEAQLFVRVNRGTYQLR